MSKLSDAIDAAAREAAAKEAGRLATHLREAGTSRDLGTRLILREQFSGVPDAKFDGILEDARCHDEILAMIRYS